jgi:hypothetical protein
LQAPNRSRQILWARIRSRHHGWIKLRVRLHNFGAQFFRPALWRGCAVDPGGVWDVMDSHSRHVVPSSLNEVTFGATRTMGISRRCAVLCFLIFNRLCICSSNINANRPMTEIGNRLIEWSSQELAPSPLWEEFEGGRRRGKPIRILRFYSKFPQRKGRICSCQ